MVWDSTSIFPSFYRPRSSQAYPICPSPNHLPTGINHSFQKHSRSTTTLSSFFTLISRSFFFPSPPNPGSPLHFFFDKKTASQRLSSTFLHSVYISTVL